MPRGTFRSDLERLSFDVNVALLGYAAEAESERKSHEGNRIATRADAESVIDRGRADVYEMEEERKKRGMR